MDVSARGQNIAVTDALQSYLETKLHKLERFPEVGDAQARLEVDGDAHVVEVTVAVAGRTLRAEAASKDMYASIDQVSDRLLHQMNRFHDRAVAHHAPNGKAERRAEATGPLAREVVRVKEFPAKPMGLDEAVLNLEFVDHDFYAFRDEATGDVCVVYRRKEGGYGLLVPQG